MESTGDLWSNLCGYIEQIGDIERKNGLRIFSIGTTYWWMNSLTGNLKPSKLETPPLETFLGTTIPCFLIAKTEDGRVSINMDIVRAWTGRGGHYDEC